MNRVHVAAPTTISITSSIIVAVKTGNTISFHVPRVTIGFL